MSIFAARTLWLEFDSGPGHGVESDVMPETYYSVQEVCELKGWTRQWVSKLIKQGRLDAVKIGREWRIPVAALDSIKELPMGRPPKSRRQRRK